jgi:hypothetical protein
VLGIWCFCFIDFNFYIMNPLLSDEFEDLFHAGVCFFWNFMIPFAVIIVLLGAFYLITSTGNPEQVKKGQKIIFIGTGGIIIVAMIIWAIAWLIEAVAPGANLPLTC